MDTFYSRESLAEALEQQKRENQRNRQVRVYGLLLCCLAGVLGFLAVVLWLGNHGTVTPLYTWLATVHL